MPNHSVCAVFCVELGDFFFSVDVLLVVNFHGTAGTPQPSDSATIFSRSSFVVSFIKILFIDYTAPACYYIPILTIGK